MNDQEQPGRVIGGVMEQLSNRLREAEDRAARLANIELRLREEISWLRGTLDSETNKSKRMIDGLMKQLVDAHEIASHPMVFQMPKPVWLPIETAPRDGTSVLLSDGRWVLLGRWYQHYLNGKPDTWRGAEWEMIPSRPREQGGCSGPPMEPTHWMPLPEAPK